MAVYSDIIYKGNKTFENSLSVIKVIVDESVTKIEPYAFYGCKALKEIKISSSVTSIGAAAFAGCINLEKIEIPDSVTSIGEGAFKGCTKLSKIKMSNNITSIGKWAFEGCINLEEIKISDINCSIGNDAFLKCKKLKKIIITDKISHIENIPLLHHFRNLEEVEIPSSVTYIDKNVFKNYKNLFICCDKGSYVEKFAKSIGLKCKDLNGIYKEVDIENGFVIYYGGRNKIKHFVEKVMISDIVTEIEKWAFEGCSGLKEIKIPNSVKCINEFAFQNCSSLEKIEIPNSVTSIRDCAFRGCNNLGKIEIPNSVFYIGQNVFNGCKNVCIYCNKGSYAEKYAKKNNINHYLSRGNKKTLSEIKTKQEVEIYKGDKSYEGNLSITKVSTNTMVSTINGKAFKGCENLEEVLIMGNSVEYICDYAFSDCWNLKKIIIPNSVSKIEENAFLGSENVCIYCNKGSYAEQFAQKKSIKYEYINNYLGFSKYFYDGKISLKGNKNVEKVVVSYNITKISSWAFAECTNLREVKIPSNIQSIASYAFDKCINLEKIEIPQGTSYIENLSFNECINLKEIEIPNSVNIIGYEAFKGCINLCIYCDKGSYAEEYAKNNNIKYQYLNNISDKVNRLNENIKNESNKDESKVEIYTGDKIFEIDKNVKKVIVSNKLTKIENGIFTYRKDLEEIEIPDTITSIGSWAFLGCDRLCIYCNKGSYAEEYAKINKIKYKYLNNFKDEKKEKIEDNDLELKVLMEKIEKLKQEIKFLNEKDE